MLLQFAENPQSLGYDTEDPDGTDAPSSVVGLQTDQQGTENGTHTRRGANKTHILPARKGRIRPVSLSLVRSREGHLSFLSASKGSPELEMR